MLIVCMSADIDGLERPQTGRQRLAREAQAERPRKHLGKDGQNSRAPHSMQRMMEMTCIELSSVVPSTDLPPFRFLRTERQRGISVAVGASRHLITRVQKANL